MSAPDAATPPPPQPEPEPAPERSTAPAAIDAGVTPAADLDPAALQERWESSLLGLLSGKARAYFGAGRFAAVDGTSAAFALPNGPHMARCESVRRDVEVMLAEQLGHPLSLVLMVDGDPVPPLGVGEDVPSTDASGATVEDEVVDPDELVDADAASVDPIGRIQDTFPGAELVDDVMEEDRP
jgi:hypothetical protein